jgi:hypothetical protein
MSATKPSLLLFSSRRSAAEGAESEPLGPGLAPGRRQRSQVCTKVEDRGHIVLKVPRAISSPGPVSLCDTSRNTYEYVLFVCISKDLSSVGLSTLLAKM